MLLSFSLSMPNCGSWNGKWSGDGNPYVIIKTFRSKDEIANAESMVAKGRYHYSWDDGWGAAITVKEVTSYEAQKLRRSSQGFHGYEWMVDTVIKYGKPLADHQIARHLESQKVKHATEDHQGPGAATSEIPSSAQEVRVQELEAGQCAKI